MRKNIFIIVVGLFSLTFLQCKKEGKKLGSFSFTAQDLQIIPYNGGETFTLINSLGDSIQYHVECPRFIGNYNDYNPSHNINHDNIDSEDYYVAEAAQVIDINGIFSIWLRFSSPFQPPIKKIISFEPFGIPGANSFMAQWSFNAGKIYQLNSDSPLVYYDSLTINNKKFYSVYGLTQPLTNTTNTISTIFYSVSQGFVGAMTTNGIRWNLK